MENMTFPQFIAGIDRMSKALKPNEKISVDIIDMRGNSFDEDEEYSCLGYKIHELI